jgi:hypothetical protein
MKSNKLREEGIQEILCGEFEFAYWDRNGLVKTKGILTGESLKQAEAEINKSYISREELSKWAEENHFLVTEEGYMIPLDVINYSNLKTKIGEE